MAVRRALTIATCLLLAIVAPGQDPPARELPAVVDKAFGLHPLWDDGQAEVARYRASRIVYGAPRTHTVHLITVFEDFTAEYYVKADWPHGQKPIVPVLKQNIVAEIPTPNYPYHYMTSLFVRRVDLSQAVKLSVTSTEWCGITSKEFQLWKDKPTQVYQSYWDGEGSGSRELPGDIADFFEEELFLVFRALPFEEGLSGIFWLYDNQTTTRAREPKPVAARFSVEKGNKSWRVNVEANDAREILLEFGEDYPHVLERYQHSDGRSLELEEVTRRAYWIAEE